MTRLPPLDLHAHVDTKIAGDELDNLRAVVFAATRSLEEAEQALQRRDASVVWGVGCHPGLVRAHKQFSPVRFAELSARTAFVSELGLDGESRVPLPQQTQTLQTSLSILQDTPHIVSLHCYRASGQLIAELEHRPILGVILHWWLGNPTLTERAVGLGCYFSFNASSARQRYLLDVIPLDRLLTETDHPFGNRWGHPPRQPGNVTEVEERLAMHHGIAAADLRRQLWKNLLSLVRTVGCAQLLPPSIRISLSTLAES